MRLFTLLTALLIATWPIAFVARADETLQQRYLAVYLKIDEAEHLEKKSDYAGAEQDFRDCYAMLMNIHDSDPAWESALVGHRLEDCRTKILDLQPKIARTTVTNSTNSLRPTDSYSAQMAANDQKDFIFANFPTRTTTFYPWKTNIVTSLFWIGESSSSSSAWNEHWTKSNSGSDDPDNRNGFAAAHHASSVNPFYVALPFNDLAYPAKAKDWVPRSWSQRIVNGKPASACKDRWVAIKSESGRICYAQWEDVGPNGNDHAEYVFGNDRPANDRAGLDISPAVAQYLGIDGDDGKLPRTSWRFVDDDDVAPGQWLKYDEQAVIYTALHQEQP